MEETRALLDQLMGRNRNLAASEKPANQLHWRDKDICPYFLCGFCPSDLFVNTKSDLGPCEYIHDEALVNQFKEEPRRFESNILCLKFV